MSQKIEDCDLLEELKNIKKLIGKTPKQRDIDIYSKYSFNAYKRAFGGLTNALIKIGEKPNIKFNRTKEDVIQCMKNIKEELGRVPSVKEFSEMSDMSYVTARKVFDNISWEDLCKIVYK